MGWCKKDVTPLLTYWSLSCTKPLKCDVKPQQVFWCLGKTKLPVSVAGSNNSALILHLCTGSHDSNVNYYKIFGYVLACRWYVFVCTSHYHHCVNLSEGIELIKCLSTYILSSVWVRFSIFSPLSIIQYVGLYVFSLPISLVMIERIYILCLVIIIKSEVWITTHCLGLGHEIMVSAVCLSIFLKPYMHCYTFIVGWYIKGLVQERRYSSVLAMELHLSCTNPPLYKANAEFIEPDSKPPQIDMNYLIIWHFLVRLIHNWCQPEGLSYLWGVISYLTFMGKLWSFCSKCRSWDAMNSVLMWYGADSRVRRMCSFMHILSYLDGVS